MADADTPVPDALVPVFAVFREMRDAKIAPDRAAYNALIDACASAGDVARAEGAFGELLASGITPDAISYTCIIKACAVAGDPRRADRIYAEMQQKSNHFSTFIPPSAYTYRHLMSAHVSARNPARVLDLFEEMNMRGLAPTHQHYLLALEAVAQHPEKPLAVERATELYTSMRESGYRLDTKTLLALDHMCKLHGRCDLASRLRSERSMVLDPTHGSSRAAASRRRRRGEEERKERQRSAGELQR